MIKYLSLISLFLYSSIFGQTAIDKTIFYGENPVCEVYFGFPNNVKSYSDSTINYVYVLITKNNERVYHSLNQLVATDQLGVNIDQCSFEVKSGDNISVVLTTLNQQKKNPTGLDSLKFVIKDFPKRALSDLQIAYSAKKSEASDSPFYKYGLLITPNPSGVFDKDNSKLYYYFESYFKPTTDSVHFDIALLDPTNKALFTTRKVKKYASKVAEIGGYNLADLPGGRYKLQVQLRDDDKIVEERSKTIYLLSEKVNISAQENGSQISIILKTMSSNQLDELVEQFKYAADANELQIYKKIYTLSDKVKFLERFFSIHAPKDLTPYDYYLLYLDKVDFVNKQFSLSFKQGIKTDRGRIYLTYGKPDDIEEFPSSNEMKPYQVWSYNNVEGGVKFYFGDKGEYGNYELLHSTKRGEVNNENWEDLLKYNTR